MRGSDTYRELVSRLEQLYDEGRLQSDELLDLRTVEFDEPTA